MLTQIFLAAFSISVMSSCEAIKKDKNKDPDSESQSEGSEFTFRYLDFTLLPKIYDFFRFEEESPDILKQAHLSTLADSLDSALFSDLIANRTDGSKLTAQNRSIFKSGTSQCQVLGETAFILHNYSLDTNCLMSAINRFQNPAVEATLNGEQISDEELKNALELSNEEKTIKVKLKNLANMNDDLENPETSLYWVIPAQGISPFYSFSFFKYTCKASTLIQEEHWSFNPNPEHGRSIQGFYIAHKQIDANTKIRFDTILEGMVSQTGDHTSFQWDRNEEKTLTNAYIHSAQAGVRFGRSHLEIDGGNILKFMNTNAVRFDDGTTTEDAEFYNYSIAQLSGSSIENISISELASANKYEASLNSKTTIFDSKSKIKWQNQNYKESSSNFLDSADLGDPFSTGSNDNFFRPNLSTPAFSETHKLSDFDCDKATEIEITIDFSADEAKELAKACHNGLNPNSMSRNFLKFWQACNSSEMTEARAVFFDESP